MLRPHSTSYLLKQQRCAGHATDLTYWQCTGLHPPFPFQGLVTSGAPSSPLTLTSGTAYWLAIDVTNNLGWEGTGSASVPSAAFNGTSWVSDVRRFLQFQIDGTPVAATPSRLFGKARTEHNRLRKLIRAANPSNTSAFSQACRVLRRR